MEEEKEPKRSVGLFDKAGKKTQEGFKKPVAEDDSTSNLDSAYWFDDNTDEVNAPEFEEMDVPEIDTSVVNLPKEDENEKALIVDHNEPADKTIVDPLMNAEEPEDFDNMEDVEVIDPEEIGETSINPNEIGEGAEMEIPEDDEEVSEEGAETPAEETPITEEEKKKAEEKEKRKKAKQEARALAQDNLKGFKYPPDWDKWTPKQKSDAIKAWQNKQKALNEPIEESVEEEPPKKEMTHEEAMNEARMLAQDDLDGIYIDEKLWSQFNTKEKLDFIKMQLDKNKDDNTYVDEDTTNNYESYKRYPTGLRIAEDARDAISDIGNRVERTANKQLAGEGGTSINDAVRQTSIPHYDYRKFFS